MKDALRQKQIEETYKGGQLHSRSDISRINTIVRLVGTRKKILDIGCYNGYIGKLIAKSDNEVYGIDLSKKAVELAREEGINAYQADIEEDNLPFEDNLFDIVVAAEIIEHVFDTDAFLEKVRQLLKPNGYLVLTTPNLAAFGRRLLLLFGKDPLTEVSCHNAAGHIRYFVKESLFEILRRHGFKIKVFTSDVINFNNSGNLFLKWPAKIFPNFGKSLIIKAEK